METVSGATVKRPSVVFLVMIAAGLLFLSTVSRLLLDPTSVFTGKYLWWRLLYLFSGFVLAPITCWTLWKRQSVGKLWGLSLIGVFAIYALFSTFLRLLQAGYNIFSVGPAAEILTTIFLMGGFAYWFGFSKTAKAFFVAGSVPTPLENEP